MGTLFKNLSKMDKKEQIKLLLSMIFDFLTFCFVILSVTALFFKGGDGNMEVKNYELFRYFTVDSNILAGVFCLVHLVFTLRFTIKGTEIPRAISAMKFSGSMAVFLTFMTVMIFLGPTIGYALMFEGYVLFLHLICPLLCFVSYCFFDKKANLPRFYEFFGVIPAFIYACVYMTMVVFIGEKAGGWEDFYGFYFNGYWYLAFAVMMLATYCFSLAALMLQKLSFAKK